MKIPIKRSMKQSMKRPLVSAFFPELLSNTEFNDLSGWVTGGGGTITPLGGGAVRVTYGATQPVLSSAGVSIIAGRKYKIMVSVSELIGTYAIAFGDNLTLTVQDVVGDLVFNVIASDNDIPLRLKKGGINGDSVVFSGLSVKETAY